MTIRPFTTLVTSADFSLAQTCGPVAWGGGRWPNLDWIDDTLVWVGWDDDRLATRIVQQPDAAKPLLFVNGARRDRMDRAWAEAVLGINRALPVFEAPVLLALAERWPGLHPFAAGNVWEGIISAIVGQSITVKAAAVTEARLSAIFNAPVALFGRRFWPLPRAEQVAEVDPALVRTCGVTQRRADALVEIARRAVAGELPPAEELVADPERGIVLLRKLPLVGRWTAESVLLWGLGAPDAYPSGDVALLRAARLVYGRPDLTMRELDELSEQWRPSRGWAARLLWLELLGPAGGVGPAARYWSDQANEAITTS